MVIENFADILFEGVLVELKCVERLCHERLAQCLNCLRASGLTVCLLLIVQKPKAAEEDRQRLHSRTHRNATIDGGSDPFFSPCQSGSSPAATQEGLS
jgi:hypothetical protein